MKVNEFYTGDDSIRKFIVLLDPLLDPPERVLKQPGVPQIGTFYTKNGIIYRCVNVECIESDDFMNYVVTAFYEMHGG